MQQKFFHTLLIALASMTLSASALAADIVVDTTSDTVDADHLDGECADVFGNCSLRAAVITANNTAEEDTITLPAGTFRLTVPGAEPEGSEFTGDLEMATTITITGAGSAQTFVDGSDAISLFHMSGTGGTLTIENLTMQRALLYAVSTSNTPNVVIRNCVLADNPESAALFASGTVAAIEDSIFFRNGNPLTSGGGLYVGNTATVAVSRTTFRRNEGYEGGAISVSGTIMIEDSLFTLNEADASGGAIQTYPGSNVTVSRSVFSLNSAATDGGAVESISPFTLRDSLVFDNSAIGQGGAFHVSGGPFTVMNSTVTGNEGDDGGAISIDTGAEISISSSTIVGNTASGEGGGIYTVVVGNPLALQNTILAGNSALDGPDCRGQMGSLGYNIVGDDDDCTFLDEVGDQLNVDPMLSPSLADNGGATRTFALDPASPAIDAGNPDGCVESDVSLIELEFDQRGEDYHRVLSGLENGVARCDIGALEFVPDNESLCQDSVDDDRDGLIDCEDDDCAAEAQCQDADGDSVIAMLDCDDLDATSLPGGTEVCGNGIDEDCDGSDETCPAPIVEEEEDVAPEVVPADEDDAAAEDDAQNDAQDDADGSTGATTDDDAQDDADGSTGATTDDDAQSSASSSGGGSSGCSLAATGARTGAGSVPAALWLCAIGLMRILRVRKPGL